MIFKYLKNYQPGNSQVRADLKTMQADIQPWVDQLVPWDRENLGLLSYNLVEATIDEGLITTGKGMFTSIYHEPLLVFNYKKYISKDTNAVLYVKTSRLEFIYRLKKHLIDLHINKQFIGTIKDESLLYSAKTKRLIARINGQAHDSRFFQIVLGDTEIGHVVNPKLSLKHNPPVFEFIKDNLKTGEEAVLLALGIPKMIHFAAPKLLLI